MVDLKGWYNSDDYEVQDFAPLPAGKYIACLTESEGKTTKKGDGYIIKCTFQILEGEYKNRKLWENFNVHNPSEQAQKIGRGKLKGMLSACGKLHASDTSDAHNIPIQITINCTKRGDTQDIQNNIVRFDALGGTVQQPQPVGSVSAPAAPVATAPATPIPQTIPPKPGKAPWEKA